MDCPAGDERDDVSEAVAGVDDEGRVLLGIFQLVFVATKVGRVRSEKRRKKLSF